MKLLNTLALLSITATCVITTGCEKKPDNPTPKNNSSVSQETTHYHSVTIKHQLGTTVINTLPKQIAALDMNEVDFVDQLNIPIAGMVKDFVPHFLEKYKNNNDIADLGSIVQPNIEKVHTLKPDLILMTPLHSKSYPELAKIAPTLHYDIDYKSGNGQINTIKNHLLDLGKIFDKQALAQQKVSEIDTKLQQVKQITANRPEKALVIMHNNGSFSNFGTNSRYGFVFNELGVKPASTTTQINLHGEPISSEFINQTDPDILYIIDRTAVMEHRPLINADSVSNPLLTQTKAWKNGRVVFVDADAWYTTAASPTSVKIMMDDVLRGYK